MLRKLIALAAIPLFASFTTVQAGSLKDEVVAEPLPVHYFRIEAGAAWSEADDAAWITPGGAPGDWDVDDDTSFAMGVAVGRTISPGLRGDVSFTAILNHDHDGCHIPGGRGNVPNCGSSSVESSVDSYLLLANVFVEPLALMGHGGGMFRPFLTAGIGAAWNDMEGWTRIEPGAPRPVRNFSGNTETNFAWAVGGGVSVDLGQMFGRGAMLDVTYRYIDAGEARGGLVPDVGAGIPQEALNYDLQFHTVTAGLRFAF